MAQKRVAEERVADAGIAYLPVLPGVDPEKDALRASVIALSAKLGEVEKRVSEKTRDAREAEDRMLDLMRQMSDMRVGSDDRIEDDLMLHGAPGNPEALERVLERTEEMLDDDRSRTDVLREEQALIFAEKFVELAPLGPQTITLSARKTIGTDEIGGKVACRVAALLRTAGYDVATSAEGLAQERRLVVFRRDYLGKA